MFFNKIGFWGILGPPSYGIGATIRIGQEMLCLPYAGFFLSITLPRVCLSLLPLGRGPPFSGITGVQFFQTELKLVRRVSADANLKRFQNKILQARKQPTLNMGEFIVAQPIAQL